MNCPACGKELRPLQVQKMVGNPAYNEWCSKGYCSSVCFESRDSSVESAEKDTSESTEQHEAMPGPKPDVVASKQPKAYELATVCLISGPLVILATGLGRGAYLNPTSSMVVLGLALLILTIGFVSGFIAFVSMRTLGMRGLFWKSVIGLTVNAGVLFPLLIVLTGK